MSLDEIVDDGSGKSVRGVLEDKHPDPEPVHAEVLLEEDTSKVEFHPAVFDSITAETIRNSALHTQGAAGPSGMDALSWR